MEEPEFKRRTHQHREQDAADEIVRDLRVQQVGSVLYN